MIETWLYIKKHNVTGLKYFGKTSQKDPRKYKGSGKRWLNHLNIHGNDVCTELIGPFYSKEKIQLYALMFSLTNNIGKSSEWANLILENGVDGNVSGHTHSEQSKALMRKNAYRGLTGTVAWNNGIHFTQEHRLNYATGLSRYRLKNPNWQEQCRAAQKIGEATRMQAIQKQTIVDGKIYPSATIAATELGLKKTTLIKRVLSKNFPTYQYVVLN